MQISHKTLTSVQNLIAAATVAARTLEGTLQMFQQHLMAKLVSGQFIKLASFIAVTMYKGAYISESHLRTRLGSCVTQESMGTVKGFQK